MIRHMHNCTMVRMCIAHTDHAHAQVELIRHMHMLTIDILTIYMLIADHLHAQVELIMHRSGDEDEDAEPENCAAPLTCKEKVSV